MESSSSDALDDVPVDGSEERSEHDVVDGASDSSSDTDSESYYDNSAASRIESGVIDSLMDALQELKKNGGYIDYGLPWSPDSCVVHLVDILRD